MMTWSWGETIFVVVMGVVALSALAWWGRVEDEPPQPTPEPILPPPQDDLDPFERIVEQARLRLPKGISDELTRRNIAIVVEDESPNAGPEGQAVAAAYLPQLRTIQIYQQGCEAIHYLPLEEFVFRVLLDASASVIPELDRETFKTLYRTP